MKYLWLIRHAKSSWDDITLRDHDRPLNKRGNRDAPMMGTKVAEHPHAPEHIVTSTALRARHTAEIFREALSLTADHFIQEPSLYHADAYAVMDVIHLLPDEMSTVALFGHNPTWTYLIRALAGDGPDNLPTTGCALIRSDAEDWMHFERGEKGLMALLYPKMYL